MKICLQGLRSDICKTQTGLLNYSLEILSLTKTGLLYQGKKKKKEAGAQAYLLLCCSGMDKIGFLMTRPV